MRLAQYNHAFDKIWIIEHDEENLLLSAPMLFDLLKAAVARIEIANREGNPILSAWLPDATAAIQKAERGEGR